MNQGISHAYDLFPVNGFLTASVSVSASRSNALYAFSGAGKLSCLQRCLAMPMHILQSC
jgi:hypothetical protein